MQLFDLVYGFFHLKSIIKQLLESVFVMCKIISVLGMIILHITKTSSNNYYTSKNPCRVSHAMRPGLKDAVKCILCIGSGNNKGGGREL